MQCKCFFEANQAAQKLDEEQKKKISQWMDCCLVNVVVCVWLVLFGVMGVV